jgi:hypothetical protein
VLRWGYVEMWISGNIKDWKKEDLFFNFNESNDLEIVSCEFT